MLFPVSGIEVAPWIPFVAGFAVAFVCPMGGVSGANLLLPFQMSVLGFVTPAVSTNHLQHRDHSQRGLPLHPEGPSAP
ncbi:hypothetical protein [Desulfonatronum sp. SC1]|uniref:hypothetical protein n=1 Tax=Desulfonatronum sp. SC1 TaxID=2109626 RepID=UPI0018EE9867|nr:hypothetical protein [Desulfonatronum sp. SC1]